MARPKKTEPKLDKQLKVYVTEKQYYDLVFTANACGVSVSALVQKLADKISADNYNCRQSALEFLELKELSEEEHELNAKKHIQRSNQARDMNFKKGVQSEVQSEEGEEGVQSEDLFKDL